MERRDVVMGKADSAVEARGQTRSGTGWVRRGIRLLLGVVAVLAILATPVSACLVLEEAWGEVPMTGLRAPEGKGLGSSQEWLSVSVLGEAQEGGQYRLRLGFQPAASFPVEAISLVAEPSERLVAVVQSEKAKALTWGGAAVVRAETDLSRSVFPAFLLTFDPQEDIVLRVELMTAKGKFVLARAKVNLNRFSFTSEYQPQLRKIRHCCECGECGRMCADCEDADFFCNCISCSISCGW